MEFVEVLRHDEAIVPDVTRERVKFAKARF
jgi:hypothetical protein